ncbi:DUF3137 domain-containing protein [Spiroplasma endosymbiont of Dactylopius coccus]
MKHNLSPKVVNEIVNNIYTDYNNSSNHWWIKLINNRLWISLWIIIIIVALVAIGASIGINKSSFIKKPFIIISIIGFIVGCFLLVQSFVLKTKIHEKLIEELPIINYYQWVIKDNNSQMNLTTISDYWTIEPQGNLPLDEQPNYYNYCEQVMIGSINGQNFNYGSIINQKVMYETSSGYNSAAQVIETEKITCYYARFVYYTTIIRNNNFTMTLTPRNIFSKKFRSKKKVQLESHLFEDLFEVKCDNQIKLRLILEPKVMNLLNEFAYSLGNKDLPVIHIENEQLTLSWKYELGKNPYNDGKGKLMVLPTTTNLEKFINKLLAIITKDILNLTQAQMWVNNLQLF